MITNSSAEERIDLQPHITTMKKRNRPDDEGHPEEDEEDEMEVDKEDEIEDDDDDEPSSENDEDDVVQEDDDEEPNEPSSLPTRKQREDSTFLDAFYILSSDNARERAAAAQTIIHHCIKGNEANLKDATYTLRRLMNGLCSGRAAARQGNASALATFLRLASTSTTNIQDKEDESTTFLQAMQRESLSQGEVEVSTLAYVRQRLLTATEPGETHGKRKGSEERDHQFGRLFGILAVVRSGILLPKESPGVDDSEVFSTDDIISVSSDLVSDLVELYRSKTWMREPAAHAVGTMLNALYALCPASKDSMRVVAHLVKKVVIPQLLQKGDTVASKGMPLWANYSAEQIAVTLNIQAHSSQGHPKGLPSPLNEPILTKETIKMLSPALSATSSVTQPRTHLVWDTLWQYITKSSADQEEALKHVDCRAQSDPTVGDERQSVHDLVDGIVRHVILECLLCADSQQGKATHERRALALCLVRNMAGVEFISSIGGRTRLNLDSQLLEIVVFQPAIIQRLFLYVICAGSGGSRKNQAEHMLKPLAMQILDDISKSLESKFKEDETQRRLAFVRAFVRCEPRFDGRTKTSTIANLALMEHNEDKGITTNQRELWNEYIGFLENHIMMAEISETDSEGETSVVSSSDAKGMAELLFNLGKHVLRVPVENNDLEEFKTDLTQRILSFFMTLAFFDCKDVKKKTSKGHSALRVARQLKDKKSKASARVPYEVRRVVSARFYSLLADEVALIGHTPGRSNDSIIVKVISRTIETWNTLVDAGAICIAEAEEKEEGKEEQEESPQKVVQSLRKQAEDVMDDTSSTLMSARKRFSVGISLLASVLSLHLLGCGRPDGGEMMDDDDPDADDAEDFEEATASILEARDVAEQFLKDSEDAESHPLASLAALCVNVLSSPLGHGSQTRGGAPRLIREIVKIAWMGGLSLAAEVSGNAVVNNEVTGLLLESVGAIVKESGEEEGDGSDEEDDDDDDSGSDEEAIFSKATAEEMDTASDTDKNEAADDDDEEEDIEINPDHLQTFLEEDSDADIDTKELEHHEGADAALAKLLKMKQDARKAGQRALERLEIAKNLRCISLIETLVLGKPEGWGRLLRMDVVLAMVPPLLRLRVKLERSIAKSGVTSGAIVADKKALLDKSTSLLRTKVLKVKSSAVAWSTSVNIKQFASQMSRDIVGNAKSQHSKDHQACCSAAVEAVIRAVPDVDERLDVADLVYEITVQDWASKKSGKLDARFFDDLIHHCPAIAQAVLTGPLGSAASTARSSFLKAESFRLLTLLFNPKLNPSTSELEQKGMSRFLKAASIAMDAAVDALQDDEMKKAKRVREVLKAVEKMLEFETSGSLLELESKQLDELSKLVIKTKEDSDSTAVGGACDKIIGRLTKRRSSPVLSETQENPAADGDSEDESTKPFKTSKAKKKKSKKSKKKKR